MAIVSRNKNALIDILCNIGSEARERGLVINENKTKYMEVTRTVVNGNHLQCGKQTVLFRITNKSIKFRQL
jgi:hypothetical protein